MRALPPNRVSQHSKVILVARGVLPGDFPPSYAVAMAVSKLVSLPPAAIGPLSVLLSTQPVSFGRWSLSRVLEAIAPRLAHTRFYLLEHWFELNSGASPIISRVYSSPPYVQEGVEGRLRVLQVRQGAETGDELTRGLPGEPLTAGDKSLLELKPLKVFLPGEVCPASCATLWLKESCI